MNINIKLSPDQIDQIAMLALRAAIKSADIYIHESELVQALKTSLNHFEAK